MKTVRFTELVKASGQPEAYTLWTAPKKDRAFQALLKAHRVLSVHQETVGTKADYGEVGYHEDRKAQILVFPKSIKRFAGKKVVGVKYDLLKQPPPEKKNPQKPTAKVAKAKQPKEEAQAEVEVVKETPAAELDRSALVAGIRKAMRLLDDGKTVAAYRTLEQMVE